MVSSIFMKFFVDIFRDTTVFANQIEGMMRDSLGIDKDELVEEEEELVDEIPEDEDDDEEEEELEEDIIDDNIEAEIHMNDLKHDPHVGQVQQQATSSSGSRQASQGFESQPKPPPPQPPQRDPSSSDLIVSYTAFQAEASATLPGGRSGKGIFFKNYVFKRVTVR